MLFVTFQLLDGRKQAKFPPFITTLTPTLLNTKIQDLKKLIHSHFKPYISPFITHHHLKLSSKLSPNMLNSIPLYMYLDFTQPIYYIHSSTQPKQSTQDDNWRFAKNLLIYHSPSSNSLLSASQFNSSAIENIFNQHLTQKDTQILINGNILTKNTQQNWVQFIQQHWKQWAWSNQCLYIKFISKD